MRRPLFRSGVHILHSGAPSTWKIDCEALSDADLDTLAALIVERCGPFGAVEGVPRGGLRLMLALSPYISAGPLLIVDDVLTTGASLEAHRDGREAKGAVIFARGQWPSWVTPLFVDAAALLPRWQAIESAPKDETRILGTWSHFVAIVQWSAESHGWFDQHGWVTDNFTHWMPLPEPPT